MLVSDIITLVRNLYINYPLNIRMANPTGIMEPPSSCAQPSMKTFQPLVVADKTLVPVVSSVLSRQHSPIHVQSPSELSTLSATSSSNPSPVFSESSNSSAATIPTSNMEASSPNLLQSVELVGKNFIYQSFVEISLNVF